MPNAISSAAPCHVVVIWTDRSPDTRVPVLVWTYDNDAEMPVPWYLAEGGLWAVGAGWMLPTGVARAFLVNGPIPADSE